MKIEVVQTPLAKLSDFFEKKIPIAVTVKDEAGNIFGGVAAKTFGLWLLIDNLWISETERGKDLGSKVLLALEEAAKSRGCLYSLLDTLDFQARPFYEKHGYRVEWEQENYPKTGSKFFMSKKL